MPENLVLKAGCFYKTRNGRKAFVSSLTSPFTDTYQPVVGWVEGLHSVQTWDAGGHYWNNHGPSEMDLVGEWREPIQQTATVGLVKWPGDCPTFIAVLHNGHAATGYQVIARKTVTITEGEGL